MGDLGSPSPTGPRASNCSPSRFGNFRIKYFRALYWSLLTTVTSFWFILDNSNLPENIFFHQGYEGGQFSRHHAKRHISTNNVLKVRIYTIKKVFHSATHNVANLKNVKVIISKPPPIMAKFKITDSKDALKDTDYSKMIFS